MVALRYTAIALLVALAAAPAAMAAQPADRGPTPGLGWGKGGSQLGAPGPVAGIGLPVLAVVGGFYWVKSRRRAADRTPR